jgi:hypothetical protein
MLGRALLWRPAPPIPALVNPARSSRARVHDDRRASVGRWDVGIVRRNIARRDHHGRGRIIGPRVTIDRRGFRKINLLRSRAG